MTTDQIDAAINELRERILRISAEQKDLLQKARLFYENNHPITDLTRATADEFIRKTDAIAAEMSTAMVDVALLELQVRADEIYLVQNRNKMQ